MRTKIHRLGVVLPILLAAASCDDFTDIVKSAPAAQKPVLDPPATGDPAGNPPPTGAPFFHSVLLKFHVPWPTLIEVAIDGVILKEEPQGCGDSGCYIVLANKEDPPGQANYFLQVYPPAYKRRANQITAIVTDVSLNPNLQGASLASEPLKLILLEAINPVLGPPSPASIPGTAEYAALHDGGFLDYGRIGLSTPQEELAYRQTLDPSGDKATFKQWRGANGFHPDDDSLDDAKAVYFNGGDLEFGRSMHMKKRANGDIAYYVSNYPTVEDARRGTNLIATVAMDYSALTPGGPRFTKFYAYRANGDAFPNPDLDGKLDSAGQLGKYLPRLCVVCHGVEPSPASGSPPGDLGARFLPFDLSSFQYSTASGFSRAEQEAEFKKLNEGVLDTNKSAATADLIEKWYGGPGRPSSTQDSDAVPSGWTGHEALYLKVIKTSCRSCHVTRDPAKDFASFANFDLFFAEPLVCASRQMPNAKVTYQRFWLDRSLDAVNTLKQAGLTHFSSSAACP